MDIDWNQNNPPKYKLKKNLHLEGGRELEQAAERSLPLEAFQTNLDMFQCGLSWMILLEQRGWSQRSLPTPTCDSVCDSLIERFLPVFASPQFILPSWL